MDLRLLGRNAVVYAIGNIGLRAASFLLIPLYTHLLPQTEFGLLSTIFFTVQIMLVLMNLGIRESLARFAKDYQHRGRMNELLGSSLLITLAGSLLVAALTIAFLQPFFRETLHVRNATPYVLYATTIAMSQALAGQMLNYYRAVNAAGRFMAMGMAIALLLVVSNAALLGLLRMGVQGALVSQVIAYGAVFVATLLLVAPRTGLRVDSTALRKVLRFGAPLVLSEASWFLMIGAPIFFLSYHAGLEEVAIYSLAFRLAQIVIIVLILPFQLAYAPFVFSNLDAENIRDSMSRALTYFAMAYTVLAFGILMASRMMIGIIAPPEYAGAVGILVLLLPAMGFEGLHIFGKTLLHIEHRTCVTGGLAVIAGGISIALNMLLIPRLGSLGAVIATNVATAFTALAVLAAGMNVYPIRLDRPRIAVCVIAFASITGLFYAALELSDAAFYLISVPAAVLGVTSLLASGFFHEPEKRFMRDMLSRSFRTLRRAPLEDE